MAGALSSGTDGGAFQRTGTGAAEAARAIPGEPAAALSPRLFSADELSMLIGLLRAPAVALPLALALVLSLPGSSLWQQPWHGQATATRVVALVLAAAALAALVGEGADRLLHAVPRRVLLMGAARAEDATRATGCQVPVLLGPMPPDSEREALARLGEGGIDDVVLAGSAASDRSVSQMAALSCALRDASVRIHVVEHAAEQQDATGPALLLSYRRSALSPRAALAKRTLDVVGSSLLLAAGAPLFAAIALAVKLDSRGPVLFAQPRLGLRGPFRLLKFRTMRVGAHLQHQQLIEQHGNMFKLRRDPRTTRVGRLLRRYSLDELPQLLHVLSGRMSLIGPRPPMPEEVVRYRADELRRLGVRPGLTGLWQVSGRSDLPFERWVELDATYIERWSPRLEASIFLRTFRAVLGGRGAY